MGERPPGARSVEEVPEALRRDVGLLASLLGRVLAETGGPDLLADVERLRTSTIALRANTGRRADVLRIVEAFDAERAADVARAFTLYFHLVNIAEERHRVRVLHERGRDSVVDESIEDAVVSIRRRGETEALETLLPDLEVHPVLTAHPTEARRRSVVECLDRIGALLARADDPLGTRGEHAGVERRLLEEITVLWRTDHLRRRRPGPLDEVRSVMAVFDQTLFRVAPAVYRALDAALAPGSGGRPPLAPGFLRVGSWVGGDRDGNPTVTADITRAAAGIAADHVLRGLEAVARRVARSLTMSDRTTPPSPELLASLAEDDRAVPATAADLAARFGDQPHRRKLVHIAERLFVRRRRAPGGYETPEALLRDLDVLQRSLVAAGASRVAFGELQDLIWQVRTFGFHLAELEIRQHAGEHARSVVRLGLDPADAVALAEVARSRPAAAVPTDDDRLETFRAMADVQEAHGTAACRRYVVSFTSSAADMVAVRALARAALGGRPLALDVIPLFESRAHLEAAPAILDDLLALPGERDRLEAQDRRLEVMLGYSDSAKEAGFLAANVALHRAQARLATWAGDRGIRLTLFHGRGGALGRGGGPTNRAIQSQAAGSVAGRFKVTEQGEIVFARYRNVDVAQRHLEQVTSAVLLASTPVGQAEPAAADARFADAIRPMADEGERVYRALVEDPTFPAFFAAVAPLEEVGRLQVGSRPARRTADADLGSLRAIPWVFAWAQTRINLPGWFGLGAGLASAAAHPGGLDGLRHMYEHWGFFRSILEGAELSLVKADMAIGDLYLALGEREDFSRAIRDEFERTAELVLRVTGQDALLERRPVLRRAVELRNPYVDALSFLQVRYLRSLRAGDLPAEEASRIERHVLVTLSGIAAGLQNTG